MKYNVIVRVITQDRNCKSISIAPLQVHYYSEALPTQDGYCVGVNTLKRSKQL